MLRPLGAVSSTDWLWSAKETFIFFDSRDPLTALPCTSGWGRKEAPALSHRPAHHKCFNKVLLYWQKWLWRTLQLDDF